MQLLAQEEYGLRCHIDLARHPGENPRTIQEIAARHKVHPNQVGAWKRQARMAWGRYFPMAPTRPAWIARGRFTISTPRSVS